MTKAGTDGAATRAEESPRRAGRWRARASASANRLSVPAAAAAWRRLPLRRITLVLVIAGAVLRVLVMLAYAPTVAQYVDSPRLTRAGGIGAFDDFWMPAGYAAFAWVLRLVSDHLAFTIAVQHLLGLVAGWLLLRAGLRWGARPWLALVPAAFVWIGGDFLFIEHLLMTEALFLLLVCTFLWTLSLAMTRRGRRVWVLLGLVALATVLVRSTGMVLVGVAVLAAALRPQPWAARWRSALAVVVTVAVGLGSYSVLATQAGSYSGLSDMSGVNLYARVAPFADCRAFTPPAGTDRLCEPSAPQSRLGPFFYAWTQQSPAIAAFGGPDVETAERAGPFARSALVAQPRAYAGAVAKDLVRYVDEDFGADRDLDGQPSGTLLFGYRDRVVENQVLSALRPTYSGLGVRVSHQARLDAYQRWTQLPGLLIPMLLLLALAGALAGRGSARLGALLAGVTGVGLYALPVAVLSFDPRYGIPVGPVTVVAGVLGFSALLNRRADSVAASTA